MAVRSGFQRRLMNMDNAPFAITCRNLIDVAEEEAAHFSCNAVVLERDIVLPEGAPKLVKTLTTRGYHCHPLPMSEFLKAGGACKCLTMFMPQRRKVLSRHPERFRFQFLLDFCLTGKQFITSSLVSQPLRAAPMPNHKLLQTLGAMRIGIDHAFAPLFPSPAATSASRDRAVSARH